MKTTMQEMLEYINGLLKIEDNLILEYKNLPAAVEDIKTNWQQLNRIKEIAITLIEKEKKQITDAFYADSFHSIGEYGEDYYNRKFTPYPPHNT